MVFRILLLLFFPLLIYSAPGYFEPWGKDSSLLQTEKESSSPMFLTSIFDKIILFHQRVISPIDGPRSNFRPTSSRYMQLAMKRYGFVKGYLMGCDRLLRENEEKWIYQTISIDNVAYKYDPAWIDKHILPK